MRRTSRSAGFSLVEALAALVITCLLVVGLFPFVGQIMATWTRGSEKASVVDMVTRGLGRVREDLRLALPPHTEDAVFRGDGNGITFSAVTDLGLGRKGVELLSITVEHDGDGWALVRKSGLSTTDEPANAKNRVVLFTGRFKYVFGYIDDRGNRQSTWNAAKMPSRVLLQILGANGPVLPIAFEMPIFAQLSALCMVRKTAIGCPDALGDSEQAQEAQAAGLINLTH
jgi:hypothetical protein